MGKLKLIILCSVLVIIVTMPDVIVEALHGLLELLVEFGHILFEILESALDTVIEHSFNTGLHQTQIIVFYIIMLVVFYGLLRFGRFMLGYCRRCKQRWLSAKTFYKDQVADYWHESSFMKKAQVILIGLTLLTGLFFLM
ncbi:MAG: hypothetical protein NTV00_16325 [Methylococcales bacterium]|nr:hypothetical protein [Methylococcales bacterium]